MIFRSKFVTCMNPSCSLDDFAKPHFLHPFNKDMISYNFTLCFRKIGYPSYIAVNAVSSRANCESRPKKNNIKKNRTDHNQGRGNLAKAVG